MMSRHETYTSDVVVDNQPIVEEISVIPNQVGTQRVLFIAGWGRSGSTLFANLLGGSPSVQNLGEFRYLWARGLRGTTCGCGKPVPECSYWAEVLECAGWSGGDIDLEQFDARVGSTAIYGQLRAMLSGRISHYRTLNRDNIDKIASILSATAEPGVVIVDSSKSIPFLINLAGDPRFSIDVLHLTRDPRAVAYSWSRLTDTQDADGVTFPRFGPIRSSVYWTIFNLAPLRFPTRFRTQLSYEDFVANPRATIESVCAHYALNFPSQDWEDEVTVSVDPQHTISGNPSRFRLGATSIREDERWKTEMRRSDRWIVTVCTAPARWILRLAKHRTQPLEPRTEGQQS